MSEELLKEEYASEEECKKAVEAYNQSHPEDEKRYISYHNSWTNKRMYVPCTIEQFFNWRNMLVLEHRKRDHESRCVVMSGKYKCLVRCLEDCEHCPYGKEHREGKPLSLDQAYEDYELEVADDSEGDMLEKIIEEKREQAMWYEISLLDEQSQQILQLFSQGLSDSEIGERLELKRTTVQYKRTCLIDDLRKKLKNI